MAEYGHRVLFLSGPVEPPWTRSDKNLVRAVASNLQRYRARVLTHEGAQPGDAHVETENAWGPRVRGDTPLGRRIGLFSRLIDSRETAIVHLFWPADILVANLVRAACKMRNIAVLHTLVRAPRTTVGIRQALAGSPVVCLTQETQTRLQAEGIHNTLWVPAGIEVKPPIATAEKAAIRRKYRIPMTDDVVTYAGDFRHSNAARTFAAAIPRILRNADAHFVFACRIRGDEDRREEARIKQAVTADGIAEHVTFLNEITSLREIFAISAIQVFPADSLHEKMDLPLVLLEGMAECVPTVVANKAPLSELVQAGVALGVPAMDPVGLSAATVELLRAPERREALGLAGRKLVEERYDISKVAARYEQIYDDMLAHPRSTRVGLSGLWGVG